MISWSSPEDTRCIASFGAHSQPHQFRRTRTTLQRAGLGPSGNYRVDARIRLIEQVAVSTARLSRSNILAMIRGWTQPGGDDLCHHFLFSCAKRRRRRCSIPKGKSTRAGASVTANDTFHTHAKSQINAWKILSNPSIPFTSNSRV